MGVSEWQLECNGVNLTACFGKPGEEVCSFLAQDQFCVFELGLGTGVLGSPTVRTSTSLGDALISFNVLTV